MIEVQAVLNRKGAIAVTEQKHRPRTLNIVTTSPLVWTQEMGWNCT